MVCYLSKKFFFQGALTGAVTAAAFVLWICLGAQIANANGFQPAPSKFVNVYDCPNSTLTDYISSSDGDDSNSSPEE